MTPPPLARSPLTLVPQRRHHDRVMIRPLRENRLAPPPLFHESRLSVRRLRPLVEREHVQLHPVHVHLVEREPQQRPQRVRPVPLRPARLLADHDAQLALPLLRLRCEQVDIPDVLALLRLDREEDAVVRHWLRAQLAQPAFLRRTGDFVPHGKKSRDAAVVDPPRVPVQVVHLRRPQVHQRPLKHASPPSPPARAAPRTPASAPPSPARRSTVPPCTRTAAAAPPRQTRTAGSTRSPARCPRTHAAPPGAGSSRRTRTAAASRSRPSRTPP